MVLKGGRVASLEDQKLKYVILNKSAIISFVELGF